MNTEYIALNKLPQAEADNSIDNDYHTTNINISLTKSQAKCR